MQTLRRLAQNREAARKSRLRKKVSEATVNTRMERNKHIKQRQKGNSCINDRQYNAGTPPCQLTDCFLSLGCNSTGIYPAT
jgi:hypothetical protein